MILTVGPSAVRAIVLVATLGFTLEARAFCRTTSVHAPPGYDPSQGVGCWAQGKTLAWSAGQSVPYSLVSSASQQVDLADATRVAHIAFAAWNDAACKGGAPSVQMYDNGPVDADAAATDCGLNTCDPTVHDQQHLIVFRDGKWPHDIDPANTLALTTVTYGIDTGTIFDADIEINSCSSCPAPHFLTTQEPPPRASNTYDLQAILTHEAGHFFGLAHATDQSAIMYAYYQPGAIHLTADDIAGVCSTYPPPQGCCSSAPGRPNSPWGAVAAVAFLALVGARRRGRRRLDVG
jgi:hypothetical protein